MAEIRWTYEAELWLKEIYEYIALDNPQAAKEVIDGIYTTAQMLKTIQKWGIPMMCPTWKKSESSYTNITELPILFSKTILIYWECFMVLSTSINICKGYNNALRRSAKKHAR